MKNLSITILLLLLPFISHTTEPSTSDNTTQSYDAGEDAPLQYPDQDYIVNNIVNPLAKKADITISCSFQPMLLNPVVAYQNPGYNILAISYFLYEMQMSEHEFTSIIAHEIAHFTKDHILHRNMFNEVHLHLAFQTGIIVPGYLALSPLYSTRFPLTPIIVYTLISTLLASHIFNFFIIPALYKRQEKEADFEAEKLYPGALTGLISFFKSEQKNALKKREADLAKIKAEHKNWFMRALYVKLYDLLYIDKYGNNRVDWQHPALFKRIKALEAKNETQKA